MSLSAAGYSRAPSDVSLLPMAIFPGGVESGEALVPHPMGRLKDWPGEEPNSTRRPAHLLLSTHQSRGGG